SGLSRYLVHAPTSTATRTLSLHDALPISPSPRAYTLRPSRTPTTSRRPRTRPCAGRAEASYSAARSTPPTLTRNSFRACRAARRSEEHTSELQSPYDLVCRLLREKKISTA